MQEIVRDLLTMTIYGNLLVKKVVLLIWIILVYLAKIMQHTAYLDILIPNWNNNAIKKMNQYNMNSI